MKRILLAGLAAGLAMAGSGARAQSIGKPVSISVRAGGFFPKGNGSTLAAFGADARVNIAALPVVGGQTVSLDYITKNGTDMTAITLVQRFSSPVSAPVEGGVRPYFGLGFGYYRLHAEGDSKSTAGVKLLAGLEFGKSLLAEVDYHLPGKKSLNGHDFQGPAVTVGLRF